MRIKLLLLITIACVSSLCTQAQDNTEKKLISLSFLGNTSFHSNDFHNYSVGILLGKYANKTKMKYWNISTTYSGSYEEGNNSNTMDNNIFESFGIGLSKGNEYYKPIFGKLSLYGGISGGVNGNFGDNQIYIYNTKENWSLVSVDLGGSAGVIYAINSKWQLQGRFLNLSLLNATYRWATTNMLTKRTSSPNILLESNQTSFQYDITPTLNLTYGLSVRYLF